MGKISKEIEIAYKVVCESLKNDGLKDEYLLELLDIAKSAILDDGDKDFGLKITQYVKNVKEQFYRGVREAYFDDPVYWDALKVEAPYKFESFLYYMEKNRPYEKKFYLPREKTLKVVVDDLQDLEDGKYKFYGLSLPSRVGKSTTCIFFLAWIALRRPNSHSAMGGHSGILAKGFYKELLNLIETEEYTFAELYRYVHPNSKTMIKSKSADEFTITLDRPDRFATITCRGIDGTWTGAIDVSQDGYLYVDDLVRDREHSLSPTRMENTYQEYLNKMVDRKNDGARELMVGTLWNVLDPLNRLKNIYEGNPEYKFRKIPALDPDTDESNFDYEINGFSTAYYKDMRERLDNAEWMAKYQQSPYVREGLLFPSDELRTFSTDNIIPEGEYRTVAIIDPAFGGGDSLSMPICVDHSNGCKYIIDWIFNKGTQAVTIPLIVDKIQKHDITQIVLEKNAGGLLFRDNLEAKLKEIGYNHCKCITRPAPNKLSKDEKINAYSDYVKSEFIFLLPNYQIPKDDVADRYYRSQEYNKAMEELVMYVYEGKNPHDDAADSLAQLAMFFEDRQVRTAQIIQSPIW